MSFYAIISLMKKRKVAIFDIDGTIFRSSLLIELVEVLIENKLFNFSARKEYEKEETEWLDRKGDYESYINAVVKVFMKNIKGISYEDFDRAGQIVIERYKNRTYRYTRDLILNFKKEGYFILAISQSPKGILDIFCERLGFDKVYGRFYELDSSGKFTGRVVNEELISDKSSIVKRAAEKENLTLEASVGVGDTEGDISFLEMVKIPICFNPNSKLYTHAKKNGWRVVVERKDVVYEL